MGFDNTFGSREILLGILIERDLTKEKSYLLGIHDKIMGDSTGIHDKKVAGFKLDPSNV